MEVEITNVTYFSLIFFPIQSRNQGRDKKIPLSDDADNHVRPRRRIRIKLSWSWQRQSYINKRKVELRIIWTAPYQSDEWLDKHPYLFTLEHQGDHRVRGELCAHCPIDSLPCLAPPGTDKECVLCIFHKGSAVATRLVVYFLEAFQVRIKATISRKRLRQVKVD